MTWQDYVFTVGTLALSAVLIPTLLSTQKPPWSTSLMTGVILTVYAFTFTQLSLWISAWATGGAALLWFILGAQVLRR